ncbi:MAG: Abi family protein [Oscillospiraceae bacterium]|jgi:abortive infection bacteriophage resistance protein|nr:Abi family protein [Oscillospiraceae bacterium]
MAKVFVDINDQITLLKNKGLQITGRFAKQILEKENYYNLINGYKSLFIDTSYLGQGEIFKKGTDFKEIYALFLFDRELRSLFLRQILEIENNVRSVLSHEFAMKYGHDNYLKKDNFDKNPNTLGDVADLISILHREIANQIKKKNPMILHYIFSYGYIPPWVLVNIISLGTLSKFYSLLEQKDQNDIGKHFKLKPQDMKTYLKNLSLARNWCAHDERFFDKRVKSQITTNNVHLNFSITDGYHEKFVKGKDDIFSIIIIFKQLLTKNNFTKFCVSLDKLIKKLLTSLHTITMDDVQYKMGLPVNWSQIKDI